jgi:hypothetical protein
MSYQGKFKKKLKINVGSAGLASGEDSSWRL